MEILQQMLERAQANPQRIVLPEGDEPRTLEAANIILRDKIANLILLGNPSVINKMAEEKGYGIVMPSISELRLQEPEIVKQSGGYGVRLSASAQSIHMIRANIETEINPIVGTEQQSEELVRYMLKEFEEDPARIWDSHVFGKSLYELVNEGLHNKLEHMPEESRTKLSETLERIINEGSGGLICIIL
jgi:stage IV sporulation protein A